ncbi:AraC family transcriptional regulator [Flagellimonas marinaquae]|uniref:AraC family transcriptional regulator n=1 Tax=Flagellimonas marinaquae TaxID=254955 RepID=UPI002074B490|nr:AraC family transcriptional regulator [Allomuricauda aquimarina]USD25949.1 AraC family transcriptional regulator [Allomuricauda aquimarina]
MKVLPFKIPKPKNEALVYQIDREHVFYDQLHQHGEIQISYVEKGSGTLIVGDRINDYKAGDILVIGSYIPHVFRSDARHKEESLMHTLFFNQDAFGKDFFQLADLSSTQNFFKKAEFGMMVLTQKTKIIHLFDSLSKQSKVEQISSLLLIIHYINKSKTVPLSSFIYRKSFSDDEGKRMGKVYDYAMEKYGENITLEEIAERANMTKNAFCRYFKKRTNKTFFQFLIEIRIENACKLMLKQPELSIGTIAEQCGFNNIANFNRKFKTYKHCTPTQYRAQF